MTLKNCPKVTKILKLFQSEFYLSLLKKFRTYCGSAQIEEAQRLAPNFYKRWVKKWATVNSVKLLILNQT